MKQKDKKESEQTDLEEYSEPKWITSSNAILNGKVPPLDFIPYKKKYKR